jgi:hypothetical protein
VTLPPALPLDWPAGQQVATQLRHVFCSNSPSFSYMSATQQLRQHSPGQQLQST